MTGPCDICRRDCERDWKPNYHQAFIRCEHCGNVIVSDEIGRELRKAHAGKGVFANRLEELSEATQSGELSELVTVQQVLAELDAWRRDRR